MATCAFCPEPLDADDESVYHEVKSWVTGPKLQSPVLRERTGLLAHKSCVDNLVHGQAPDQAPLFEVAEERDRCSYTARDGNKQYICNVTLDPDGSCPNQENHEF